MSMLIDSRLVIQGVKEHPCLYDQTSTDFNNRAERMNAWIEVTMKVLGDKFLEADKATRNQVCAYVQKRWRHLRDSYVKAIKMKKTRPYVFSEDMSFLDIGLEKTLPKLQEKPYRIKTANIEKDPLAISPQAPVGSDTPGSRSRVGTISGGDLPPDISRPGKKPGSATEFEKVLLNIVKNNVEHTPKLPDADDMFFLSLMPYIKALSPTDVLDFKCKFMDLLKSYTTFHD